MNVIDVSSPGPRGTAVDWSVLDDLAVEMEDEIIVGIVLEAYLGELPRRADDLRTARAEGGDSLRDAAHALGSPSLIVGATRLGRLCKDVEKALKSAGAQPSADELVGDTLVEIALVATEFAAGRPASISSDTDPRHS